MKSKILIAVFSIILGVASMNAQESTGSFSKTDRVWEFGIGGTVYQFSRVGFSNFSRLDKGYAFDLNLDHALWGGGLYVARKLNNYFYLDLQSSVGFTDTATQGHKQLFMAGVGLQWRLGRYFSSNYIDPYLRVGGNYMYKGFDMLYTGTEGLDDDEMSWVLDNFRNKEGADRKHLIPLSVGMGVNMWLNDRFGIGMQTDYLIMPYAGIANSWQGTVRLLWRIGY